MGSIYRITLHWTGGQYKPNAIEKEHYHFMVDSNGKVYEGKYKPEDNINCAGGKYAQHCGGGNTGNIGVALCCYYNRDLTPTRVQVEAMCKLVAELSKKYGVTVNNKNILTHSEFGFTHPDTTSNGKIDIDYLPCVSVYGRDQVGDYLREKIAWYKNKIK